MSLSERLRPNLRLDLSTVRLVLQPPTIERKYVLHEIIGQGSAGVVRRATLRGSSEQFAVKTLYTDEEEKALIAEKECELLSCLYHPNIIKISEFILDLPAGRVDTVMPLISGSRLDVFVKRRGHLSDDVARHLFTQLMRGVLHCHNHRVCHRDIKPENIMVSDEDRSALLILMDFNAACKVGGLTPTGTLHYMAPEAWRARELYNEMTDVWSSGICLYFMLAGFLPWIGERKIVLATEVSSFPIRFPASLSTEALSLLSGMLCRDVAVRLMVLGALVHPWCKLSAEEVRDLFRVPGVARQPAQPSYRNWEIKARKTITDGNTKIFGPPLELPPASTLLPKNLSWPSMCGASDLLPSPMPCKLLKPASRPEHHWLSNFPSKHSGTLYRACVGWELRLRQQHLVKLYGPRDLQPSYRDWETRLRREMLKHRGC